MENPQESQEIIWVCVKGVRPEKRKSLNPLLMPIWASAHADPSINLQRRSV
jgi:hypothetical protein